MCDVVGLTFNAVVAHWDLRLFPSTTGYFIQYITYILLLYITGNSLSPMQNIIFGFIKHLLLNVPQLKVGWRVV